MVLLHEVFLCGEGGEVLREEQLQIEELAER
jgi:hypothetical protein